MTKTGILGGTFDPVHLGHMQMILAAYREFDLDELWLMPNGTPPHKSKQSVIASARQRLAMTELAVLDIKKQEGSALPIMACDYESSRTDTSYSFETMEHFAQIYPEREFYFIVGADSLMNLTRWMKPERLLRCCVMLAAIRLDDKEEDLLVKIKEYEEIFPVCDIRLLHMPRIDISASEIRRRLKEGKDLSGLVSPSVLQFIRENPSIYAG